MKKVYEPANATELALVSAALEAAEIPFVIENEERFLGGSRDSSPNEIPVGVVVPETAQAAARKTIRRALKERGAA